MDQHLMMLIQSFVMKDSSQPILDGIKNRMTRKYSKTVSDNRLSINRRKTTIEQILVNHLAKEL